MSCCFRSFSSNEDSIGIEIQFEFVNVFRQIVCDKQIGLCLSLSTDRSGN